MAKAKKFVVAVFEKPTECRECPCSLMSPGYHIDICQLAKRRIEIPVVVGACVIPEWCPLVDVKDIKSREICNLLYEEVSNNEHV